MGVLYSFFVNLRSADKITVILSFGGDCSQQSAYLDVQVFL